MFDTFRYSYHKISHLIMKRLSKTSYPKRYLFLREVDLISKYVVEFDVVRPDDLIVKSTGVNSGLKLFIIQNTDRKLPLIDIAKSKGLEMDQLIKEMEVIIYSGTKLNIDYSSDDLLDEDQQEDIYEYFMEAESDNIQEALDEFDGEYDEEELRLMRIKFINEVAN